MQDYKLTITGFSTALFSTWYFVDELSALFDCGDGASAGMMQKSRKIKHVFVSHADRDHVAGLLQFSQLNSRAGLRIYYPKDSGSFPALEEFTTKFDPQSSGAKWIPLNDGDEIQIKNNIIVRAKENAHVRTEGGQLKSLSFFVDLQNFKLKPEHHGKPGPEIGRLRKELGREAIENEERRTILAYSADTPIETDGRWNEVETLIHEATFLTAGEIDPDNPRRNKHSSLDQVLAVVAGSNIKRLVLGHFSSRYDNDQIDEAIRMYCEMNQIKIPVFRVLPGEKVSDVLNGAPIYDGSIVQSN